MKPTVSQNEAVGNRQEQLETGDRKDNSKI